MPNANLVLSFQDEKMSIVRKAVKDIGKCQASWCRLVLHGVLIQMS